MRLRPSVHQAGRIGHQSPAICFIDSVQKIFEAHAIFGWVEPTQAAREYVQMMRREQA